MTESNINGLTLGLESSVLLQKGKLTHLWETELQDSVGSIAHTSARPSEGQLVLFKTEIEMKHQLLLTASGCHAQEHQSVCVSSKSVQPWGTKAAVIKLLIHHCNACVEMSDVGLASIAITGRKNYASCEVLLVSPGFFLGWQPCADFGDASL